MAGELESESRFDEICDAPARPRATDLFHDQGLEIGMSSHPEYYAGRGVNVGDCNGRHLQKLYDAILKTFGGAAARNFAQMISDLEELSATGVLLALYRLENNNWVHRAGEVKNSVADDLAECAADMAREGKSMNPLDNPALFGGLASAMYARGGGEMGSESIREDFLDRIGFKADNKPERSWEMRFDSFMGSLPPRP